MSKCFLVYSHVKNATIISCSYICHCQYSLTDCGCWNRIEANSDSRAGQPRKPTTLSILSSFSWLNDGYPIFLGYHSGTKCTVRICLLILI